MVSRPCGVGLALMIASHAVASTAWADPPATVKVHGEDRVGFGRIVFDYPDTVRFRLNRIGDHVVVEFTDSRLVGEPATLPRNVAAMTGAAGRMEIVVAADAQIRPGRMPNRIVLDVMDTPATTPPLKHDPSPPAHLLPARPLATEKPDPPSHPAADVPGPERSVASERLEQPNPTPASPPSSPVGAPVPPAASQDTPDAETRAVRPPCAFVIPAGASTGAAAFRRNDIAVIVLDEPKPWDPGTASGATLPAGLRVVPLTAATVVQFPLPLDQEVALDRRPEGWGVACNAAATIPPRAMPVRGGGRSLIFAAADPGSVVAVVDPVTGANLLVGTQRRGGQSIVSDRQAASFVLPPSWQGVVVEPLSEQVVLTAARDGFVLTAEPGGLDLAQGTGGAGMAATESLTRRFDFPALPQAELVARLQNRVGAAAAAPPLGRPRKRRQAAETMVALGLGAEAEAMLAIAGAEDARAAEDPDAKGLSAIAALLAGRPAEADALMDPRLTGSDEIAMWRALRDVALDQTSSATAATFTATTPLVLSYPVSLRARILPIVAETLAASGETMAASQLLAACDPDAFPLARAMLLEARHDPDGALAGYDAVMVGPDRLARVKAARRATALRLAAGQINAAQAADQIERMLVAWRGDRIELDMRRNLAELRLQAGQWRLGLAALRDARDIFPDQADAISAALRERFVSLVKGPDFDRLAPLDFVALLDENADLLPDGPDGEAIATLLADRLGALDLPKRAAPLLDKLIANNPPGAARGEFGARLAELDLQQYDPAAAVQALARSDSPDLGESLQERRGIDGARAQAGLGHTDTAITALMAVGTPAADEARAALLEQAHDWPAAERALADLVRKTVPPDGALDDSSRHLVLRLASAAAAAGDEAALSALRGRESERMGQGPVGAMFQTLTAEPVRDVADLPRAGKEMALARNLPKSLPVLTSQ